MKRILILAALLLSPAPGQAAYYSSDYLRGLLDNCNALPETFAATPESFASVKDCGLSTGYILGVVDALGLVNDRKLCFPRTIRSEELVAAVQRWIHGHPDQVNRPADEAVDAAVRSAWACPE